VSPTQAWLRAVRACLSCAQCWCRSVRIVSRAAAWSCSLMASQASTALHSHDTHDTQPLVLQLGELRRRGLDVDVSMLTSCSAG
jgi:hypothetical protein